MIEKVSNLLGLLAVAEEERVALEEESDKRADQVDHLSRKGGYLQDRLQAEEDAKRSTLLKYIHAIKTNAQDKAQRLAQQVAEGKVEGSLDQLPGAEILLPESGIGDEEVHALAAMLRGNTTISSLNLRGNHVTDE